MRIEIELNGRKVSADLKNSATEAEIALAVRMIMIELRRKLT